MGRVRRFMRAITQAESEVSRLEQAVVRWQGEAEQKQTELAELEATAGDRVLADETGTLARTLAVDAQELRFLIDGARAAAEAAARQLRTARADLCRAKAAEARQEAEALHRQADAHQVQVDALLAQLHDLDGVDYVWMEPDPGVVSHGVAQSYNIPKASALRIQAAEPEHRALQLEADAQAAERGVPSTVLQPVGRYV